MINSLVYLTSICHVTVFLDQTCSRSWGYTDDYNNVRDFIMLTFCCLFNMLLVLYIEFDSKI